jgi:hypothetical protein
MTSLPEGEANLGEDFHLKVNFHLIRKFTCALGAQPARSMAKLKT